MSWAIFSMCWASYWFNYLSGTARLLLVSSCKVANVSCSINTSAQATGAGYDEGWHPNVIGELPAYFMRFYGQNGDWTFIAQVVEEQRQIVFFSVAPSDVPADRRLAMAEEAFATVG